MNDFGRIGGDARRAHLALVQGGLSTTPSATQGVEATPRASAATRAHLASTGYAAQATGSVPRSRHESGVRAVARAHESFEDALLPMVLASGVSRDAAATVAATIMASPALRAQAERAFARSRMGAV